jgi:hypothetical protein
VGEGVYRTNCVAALFDQIEYHPAEAGERPQPLWQMRLPVSDAPGFAFDGTNLPFPDQVVGALGKAESAKEPRERPIEIELRPVPSIEREVA